MRAGRCPAADLSGTGGPSRTRDHSGYRDILRLAWPIMLANAAMPLLGLVDTAIIGRTGSASDLGAIALGALLFNFLYWGFGFLRMGTTGFVAQADGAGDEAELRATLLRALVLGGGIGGALMLLQWPLSWLFLGLFQASAPVEALAADYFAIRIWAAPASLAGFALTGLLIGLGETRRVLALQLFLNTLNIVLDLVFAAALGWGVAGIALGTTIAEWCSLLFALGLVLPLLRRRHRDAEAFLPWALVRARDRVRRMLAANGDIMLRTLCMLAGFAWFTNLGAGFGDATLAANHILLLFISFSAYFLDGYAHVAEVLIGRALGARDRRLFDRVAFRSGVLAALTAGLLALAFWLFGRAAIDFVTRIAPVASIAGEHLAMCCAYIALSFVAFQLDGIFIGATRSKALRNASAAAVAAFFLVAGPFAQLWANHGLWLAFVLYVCARAVALGAAFPALRRSVAA